MRASTLPELFDFEGNWDASLAAVLAPIGIPVHIGAVTEKMDSPYIAGFFTFAGEAPAASGVLPQVRGAPTAQAFDGVSFRGRFNIFLALDRSKVTPAQSQAWRGAIRERFLPSRGAAIGFNGVTVPFYDVRTVTWAAGDRIIDEERDLDQTSMVFEFDWAILTTAWPT